MSLVLNICCWNVCLFITYSLETLSYVWLHHQFYFVPPYKTKHSKSFLCSELCQQPLLWQIYCSIILLPPSICKQHHHGSVRMWQKYRSSALISGLLLFYNYNSLLMGNHSSSTLLVFGFPHLFFSSPSFQIVHLATA